MFSPGGGERLMTLAPGQDFYSLRREGIGHIVDTGSAEWTDYNLHDPGITILEVLAYTITELAYRANFPIEDILASAEGATPDDPYPDQAFYSPRSILTVNPTTADDFRRVLINVDSVRNAWVRCKTCACDAPYFAWCEDDELVLSHYPSQRHDPTTKVLAVEPRGLYDVLIELESDPGLGDLNDRKIVRRRSIVDTEGRRHIMTIEVRFPEWELSRRDERRRLAEDDQPLILKVTGPTNTTTGTSPVDDTELRSRFFNSFYVDYEATLADNTKIIIENAAVRLYGDKAVRDQATVASLLGWLGEAGEEGFVSSYRDKLSVAEAAMDGARAVLEAHRNLDEDYCHIELVEIVEIAVCADVEVEPASDIDLVQAQIWYEIERYLSPPVEFWTLQELRARGEPVEAIFNGPELHNGFLTQQGLADADLRSEIRTSDIINRLLDIDGVISVEHLQMTAYDASGSAIAGIADPDWNTGIAVFDPSRISASWLLILPEDHRPRLHRGLSQFLFSSNGLPFVPRLDEVEDTVVQLHGRAARPKIRHTDLDLAAPSARRRQLDSYHPVQHSFPLVYGIGPAGLPSTASVARNAQAKQLKAYLMVYEQLLRNAYAQVEHVGQLFSLDPDVENTYFTAALKGKISGYDDIVLPALEAELPRMVETPAEFVERRNRFLDHLLARFGESFDEYAMMLTDLKGQGRARETLMGDKLALLNAFPEISHDRGKAYDRLVAPCDPDNASGLQQRISLLLGLPDWTFGYRAADSNGQPGFEHVLTIEQAGQHFMAFSPPPAVATALAALLMEAQVDTLAGSWSITGVDGQLSLTKVGDNQETTEALLGPNASSAATELGREVVDAQRAILGDLVLRDRYTVSKSGSTWKVTAEDAGASVIGATDPTFGSRSEALGFIDLISTWAAHRRAVVVEHLLLRPKFPGDALYPSCSDGPCCLCGDEDPYSFRLTYVMPGWTAPFNTNMSMRGFAERTIKEQTPSHLIAKTCWVGNDGYVPDPCDPVIDTLASVLDAHTATHEEACTCAAQIYEMYAAAFQTWFANHTVTHDPPEVIASALATSFATEVDLTGVSCSAAIDDKLRAEVEAVLVEHFGEITVHGYQFERFEDAWCEWVRADAAIDWTEERLQDTVLELLSAGVTSPVPDETLGTCAATMVTEFGGHFREWMDENIASGKPLADFPDFDPPPIAPCAGLTLTPGTAQKIRTLLIERYATYAEVSHRLYLLVHALAELRSTYPQATLHDCDEGSDFNPVRLGQTALGNN
jgi:hypothetical protein